MIAARPVRLFVAALFAASFSACSGNSSPVPNSNLENPVTAGSQSLVERGNSDASTTTVFVSDASTNIVYAVGTNGKVHYQLTGFSEPEGLAVDAAGALYVADTANDRIVVFATPHGGAPVTLGDPGEFPAGVAVAPVSGIVAAANIISTSGGAGSVSFYRKGASSPCTIVSSATEFARAYFDAFDKEGHLFLTGTDANGKTTVGEITGGCKAKGIQKLTLEDVSLTFPGLVGVNAHDQLVLAGSQALYTFAKPVRGVLGKPLATTSLSGIDSASFAFAEGGNALWAVDSGVPGVAEFAYPMGGSPIRSIPIQFSQPIGIAVSPAEIP